MKKWKTINSEKIIDNKWLTVEKQTCDMGNGKIINDYYVVKKSDYVILIVEDNDKILFVKQYRHGIGEIIINLPMGLVDDKETLEETAKRELTEETGYESEEFEYLGGFYTAPSYIKSRAHIFYTNKAKNMGIQKKDPNEEIILVNINKSELKKLIENNEINDMPTLTALYIAKEKLNLLN